MHSLNGVFDAGDGEKGGQICSVGGDDNQSEEPPNPHHHPRGQSRVGHLAAYRGNKNNGGMLKSSVCFIVFCVMTKRLQMIHRD